MFTELSLGYWSSGHRNYQVSSSAVFSFVSLHAHSICPLYNVLLEVVYILLNMPMFVGSQSFISLPSFMFVNAAVSEIHELNQNKKENNNNSEILFPTPPFLGT